MKKNRNKTISQVFSAIKMGLNNKMFEMKTPNRPASGQSEILLSHYLLKPLYAFFDIKRKKLAL